MDDTLTPEQRVLVRAAELINIRENWIKGSYRDGARYCAVGAIEKAANEIGHAYDNDVRTVKGMVRKHVPKEGWGIEDYNDDPLTTYEEVKELFCKSVKAELGDKA